MTQLATVPVPGVSLVYSSSFLQLYSVDYWIRVLKALSVVCLPAWSSQPWVRSRQTIINLAVLHDDCTTTRLVKSSKRGIRPVAVTSFSTIGMLTPFSMTGSLVSGERRKICEETKGKFQKNHIFRFLMDNDRWWLGWKKMAWCLDGSDAVWWRQRSRQQDNVNEQASIISMLAPSLDCKKLESRHPRCFSSYFLETYQDFRIRKYDVWLCALVWTALCKVSWVA